MNRIATLSWALIFLAIILSSFTRMEDIIPQRPQENIHICSLFCTQYREVVEICLTEKGERQGTLRSGRPASPALIRAAFERDQRSWTPLRQQEASTVCTTVTVFLP